LQAQSPVFFLKIKPQQEVSANVKVNGNRELSDYGEGTSRLKSFTICSAFSIWFGDIFLLFFVLQERKGMKTQQGSDYYQN